MSATEFTGSAVYAPDLIARPEECGVFASRDNPFAAPLNLRYGREQANILTFAPGERVEFLPAIAVHRRTTKRLNLTRRLNLTVATSSKHAAVLRVPTDDYVPTASAGLCLCYNVSRGAHSRVTQPQRNIRPRASRKEGSANLPRLTLHWYAI